MRKLVLAAAFMLSATLSNLATAHLATASLATAATPTERLRGTVAQVGRDTLVLGLANGARQTLRLAPGITVTELVKSDLDAIAPGGYVGVAAKGSGITMTALEVVVFPPAMRDVDEGHFAWDPLPDITVPGVKAASSMTNGNISAVTHPQVKAASSMTRGSVQTVSSLYSAKQISIVYPGGKQIVMVLPATPVVAARSGSLAGLQPGQHVVLIVAGQAGQEVATHVIAGENGLVPPM